MPEEPLRSRPQPDVGIGLRGLANFFEHWAEYRLLGPETFSRSDEVQSDLRRWADEYETILLEVATLREALQEHHCASCDGTSCNV